VLLRSKQAAAIDAWIEHARRGYAVDVRAPDGPALLARVPRTGESER